MMNNVRTFRGSRLGIFLVAITVVLVVPMTANAHYVYEEDEYYLGNSIFDYKLKIRSEVSHGSHNGGYYKSNIEVCSESTFGFCLTSNGTGLWVRQQHFYWAGDMWIECTSTNWIRATSDMKVELAINTNHGHPACGDGYYGVQTAGYYWNPVAKSYQSLTHWSGYHYLPD